MFHLYIRYVTAIVNHSYQLFQRILNISIVVITRRNLCSLCSQVYNMSNMISGKKMHLYLGIGICILHGINLIHAQETSTV